ncbi:glycoside hydrolase superfamily [Phaeosphaeriaceae sp. PMI808]|nr:glycoside hydrolase superfamily [Phaeosphaeriaceae sp. PMI808]
MIFSTALALLLSSTNLAEALGIRQASKGVATVDISKSTGPAKVIASGWIYGFPDNGTSVDSKIPEHFVRDIKFVGSRSGGAQIPPRGWVAGLNDYIGRFNSTLSNYRTTRNYGGDFILLVHDLWGADGGSIATFPGDNGNWSSADAFLKRLASDLRANNMLEGLVIDLWNEPDLNIFWARSWEQFLQYYVRSHKFFRNELKSTLISGPSAANIPKIGDQKWLAWFKAIAGNNAIPDIYSWHQIGSWSKQPDQTLPDFNTMKAPYSLPNLPIDINEYAAKEEQNPANSVYYIAQLERHNMRGLRANWGSGSGLHDYLGNLVYKKNGVYYPNGEWHLYKYYAEMKGDRVATTASSDRQFDVFATKSGNQVNIIAGTRSIKAAYEIKVSGLQSLGLPASGSVRANVVRFDWAGDRGEIKAPVDLGSKTFTYTSNTLSILMDPPTNATAYAYQLNI